MKKVLTPASHFYVFFRFMKFFYAEMRDKKFAQNEKKGYITNRRAKSSAKSSRGCHFPMQPASIPCIPAERSGVPSRIPGIPATAGAAISLAAPEDGFKKGKNSGIFVSFPRF